ncbi:MAG: hypothetical protein M1296_05910 [Chloroflexi bacterium]|nr:hypothetical protein [Chloroflexota bacterium]
MASLVHTYIRRRGTTATDPVDLNYLATGKHLQEDTRTLATAQLPQPDLLHGVIHCSSLEQASQVVMLHLHGLYTRDVQPEDGDTFFTEHPEFIGPPRIQLKQPRTAAAKQSASS